MRTSESIDKLAEALAKAQGEFDTIHRTRRVKVRLKDNKGEYSFLYAPLDEILRATRKPLTDNGLAIVHPCSTEQGKICCGTRLIHSSGQWVESTLEFTQQASLQDVGSALTYLKRYTLCGLLGVTADEDDDANVADGNVAEVTEREPLPECPNCKNNSAVIEGKPEYGGGLVCFKKKGGCGLTWGTDKYPSTEKQAEPKKETKKKSAAPSNDTGERDLVTPYSKAAVFISNCADVAQLKKAKARIVELVTAGEITDEQVTRLDALVTAREKILSTEQAA